MPFPGLSHRLLPGGCWGDRAPKPNKAALQTRSGKKVKALGVIETELKWDWDVAGASQAHRNKRHHCLRNEFHVKATDTDFWLSGAMRSVLTNSEEDENNTF